MLEGDLADADGPASAFVDIIGLPFTPLSVAGVARRTTRRAAWYGAAAAAAAPYYYPPWVPAPLLSVSLSSSLMKDNLT